MRLPVCAASMAPPKLVSLPCFSSHRQSKLEFIFRTTGIASESGGFLTAGNVTVADLYLNAIIGFLGVIGVAPKLAPATLAGLKAYSARVEALPEISAALAAIGSPTKPPQ